jgi:hypothetical protein
MDPVRTPHCAVTDSSGCSGALYTPAYDGPTCYLKGNEVASGTFDGQSEEATATGTTTSLIGRCDDWASFSPSLLPRLTRVALMSSPHRDGCRLL